MGATILVVDDDGGIRELVAEWLEAAGYQIVTASNGEDALRVLHDKAPLSLVISDIRMPGMSGLELAEQAVKVQAGLKIILMSGYFQPQPMGVRCLKKPFPLIELERAVHAELSSSSL